MKKKLLSTNPFIEPKGRTKFCSYCDGVCTQEALFEVSGSGVTLIEKYCDMCVKKVKELNN